MKMTFENKLLADLLGEYIGITLIESWPKIDGSRGYRYTDASGTVYPVWSVGADTKDLMQAFRVVLDSNAQILTNENMKKRVATYIVTRKSAA